MRPNRLIVQAYLSRGARLWLIVRAMLSGVFLLAGTNPVRLSALVGVEIVLLTGAVSFLEIRRRRERALLANLGVRPLVCGALSAAPALIGELALRAGGTAFR